MLITFILASALIFGIYLDKKSDYSEPLWILIAILSGLILTLHLIFIGMSGYQFQKFKVQMDSFASTLEIARTNANQFEVASITRDVSEWNEKLALYKYQNTLYLLDSYIDDRVEKLKPIK